MDIPGFVIPGPPRTKKTSNRVISIPKKGAHRCARCGHMPGFPKVLPSEAYEQWEAAAVLHCAIIKAALRSVGVELPITAPVSVDAQIYRDRNVGDVCGYQQAIGDMLQDAGIISNDSQIEDWDGTRRRIDRESPRVEIWITMLEEGPQQLKLQEVEGW